LRQKVKEGGGGRIVTDYVQSCIDRANKYNPTQNSYITIFESEALAAAGKTDRKFMDESDLPELPLDGVAVAVKDNFCMDGQRTTAGSKMLDSFVSPYDSTVVKKLKDSGAIIVGKTNMDEFGMGSYNVHSHFGPVRNPLDERRCAGGSSGGSAAAVAAETCTAAIGSDTGGSIRLPAAYCGIVGIKPGYGYVSRWGLIAYASSLDTPGVLSRTLNDGMRVVECITGWDELDSTAHHAYETADNQGWKAKVEDVITEAFYDVDDDKKQYPLKGITIGVPIEFYVKELPELTVHTWKVGVSLLESLGATVKEVSIPSVKHALPSYYIISSAEAASNLSKYDGIRYGFREEEPDPDKYVNTRSEGFGETVKRRILTGNYVLSNDQRKLYENACDIRDVIVEEFDSAFEAVDVLLAPTTTNVAPLVEDAESRESVAEFVDDVLTVPASLARLPSLCIPVSGGSFDVSNSSDDAHDGDNGSLLQSLQIMGPRVNGECAGGFSEDHIVVAHALERFSTAWADEKFEFK
jgi:aspartyl-tRNA(Asn)/glutamyl-tRNA(Gln) amidotransferase subunit A